MKRIKAACICQTLHFQLKEDQPRSYAARMVQEEVKRYKESLDASRTHYRIEEETTQPDGSGVRGFLFNEDGTETAIDGIESITPAPEQPIYDLSGRRVQKAGKGLYIVGGKKVFFK